MGQLKNMPELKYSTRQAIIKQALEEIQFARVYKQGKTGNWRINEDLYYGKKIATEDSRANVDLGQAGSFIHTTLSKIDNPLTFKYTKRKSAQLQRVKWLNALKTFDAQRNDWDIKDIVGKKQGLIYGRVIYSFYAESENGYKANLENIDVYDFLIDPSAGGIDIERAMYLGNYGVIKSRDQLKKGIKSGEYLKTETEALLAGGGNSTEMTQEETNKLNRTQAQGTWRTTKEIGNPDKFKFWQWYTTYEGERYYLLLSERGGQAIRIVKLSELFESGLWPFWTWAAFMDLTEFWTPSYLDYVRELFIAESVSINQMIDNAEEYNKPMKAINVGAVENLSELKFRKNGYIRFRKDFDISKALQILRPNSIDTPISVFKLLEQLHEKNSGVTAAAQGDDANGSDSKVAIYEGNQANAADRFGLLNKSYAMGYKRFAKLYEHGVREHLVKKVAIDILGPDGVEVKEVSRRDIFRKGEDFGVLVEASNAELALSEREKAQKMAFLKEQQLVKDPSGKPVQNAQKAYEMMASIVGLDDETIRQLMDTDNFGTAEIMAEADRDIEAILDGEEIKPNQGANTAYKQRFVDYMRDNQENITMEEWYALSDYVLKLEPIINRNMVRSANELLTKGLLDAALGAKLGNGAQPNGGVGGQPEGGMETTPPADVPIQ